ncbi:hypothetical protein HPP92_017367 [Vanilla planifolia]|uniref:Uncharacterized protein n=1 Tax=Vanilla planifolia TaxID=51239 RepID=A0A835QN05_VANPL|nr:hypothetical protein HPP92_017367 [Vanilla planifolia]
MGQLPAGCNEIFATEELRAAHLLHLPVVVVHQHVSGPRPAGSGKDARCEDGRHPARALRGVPSRAVDEDDVPRNVVEVVGEVVDAEAAVGEEEVLDRTALAGDLSPRCGKEVAELADLRGVGHVVALEARVLLLEVRDVVLVLVHEDGAPAVVERAPQEALRSKSEDEKVAGERRRRTPATARRSASVMCPLTVD